MTSTTLPTLYISHGGGPWPWMDGPMRSNHEPLAVALRQLPTLVGAKPEAVLMLSAHWEATEFTLMTHPHPPMLYDYGGFPPHTYQVKYPAPGAPELAERVRGLIEGAGFAVGFDPARGFDHGTFVPMAVAWPAADVPVLQLSLRQGLDPKEHLAMGRALAPLRDEGVLIIGSGSSYHNLRMMGAAAQAPSLAFDAWLQRTMMTATPPERTAALQAWERAPSARAAHPREEHLLPLMVAVGAAEHDQATLIYHQADLFGGAAMSSFLLAAG